VKGVVLAGGTGSRLRPITFTMAKQLVPVGGEVRTVVGDGSRFGQEIEWITQDEPLGLAHALKTALPFVDGDDCLMYLGDNLVKDGVADVVRDFEADRPNCQIMLSPVENPSAFGVADLAEDGSIKRLVEKPTNPPSDLALVGVYLFDPTIEEAVNAIEPSARGELEITDAIQYLVESGRTVRASIVSNWWKDTGTKSDLLHAQELLISELAEKVEGELVDTRVRGKVHVGAGSQLVDCDITGPAVIGDNVQMSRTSIGPQTSIGDDCRLSDAAVERSIVLEGAEIHGWRIRDSLLGRGAKLHGVAPPSYVEMTLGERSEIVGE
jgi:glucose-1-phosphate thymidylyltransferase